jgi:serine/threonine protein phosphatase PrpC
MDWSIVDFDVMTSLLNVWGGCTCTLVLAIDGSVIYVANLGDSNTILFKPKQPNGEILFETISRNPSLPEESERILASGHSVRDGRIDGDINISRTFGDFRYKKNTKNSYNYFGAISAIPDVSCLNSQRDLCMLLVSDGALELFSPENLIEMCTDHWSPRLDCVAQEMLEICKKHTTDDVTIMLVCLF